MTASTWTNILSGLAFSIASMLAAGMLWQPHNSHMSVQNFSLPNLWFPDPDGQWGCKFYNSCKE